MERHNAAHAAVLLHMRIRTQGNNYEKQSINTYLAFITLEMKTTIQRDNSNSFFLTRFGHNWLLANTTSWSEFPVIGIEEMERSKVEKC